MRFIVAGAYWNKSDRHECIGEAGTDADCQNQSVRGYVITINRNECLKNHSKNSSLARLEFTAHFKEYSIILGI